jgi:hypothetical protein
MKNRLFILAAVLLCLVPCIRTYSWGWWDQNQAEEEPAPPPLEKGGGLEEIDAGSQEALEALEFLKQDLNSTNPEIRIVEVVQAFHQVVAGYNTVLICTYEDTVQSKTLKLFARVYTNLENKKEVIQLELDYRE